VPKVDAVTANRRYKNLYTAIQTGLIASAHDISDGGLAIAASEMAFAGEFGLEIALSLIPTGGDLNNTEILYSETPSRILIAVEQNNKDHIEKIFGGDAVCIGKSNKDKSFKVKGLDQKTLIDTDISTLKKAWKATLDF
jgi:phosphoribosylformylglycinamidine synthase